MIKADPPLFASVAPSLSTVRGVRVRADCVFANFRGEIKPGIRKRAEKCIEKLQEPLRKLLAEDEAVLCIFRCLPPLSALEQYFLSWAVTYSHSVVLVITNKRLLQMGVLSGGAWRRNVRELSWDAVAEASVKGWLSRVLQLRYGDGSKQRYWRIRAQDAKKIRALLPVLFPPAAPRVAAVKTWTSLCPECFHSLTPQQYACAGCGLIFKDERGLVWPLILIPGGGYFYCRQPLLGSLHAIGEGLLELWMLAVLVVLVEVALNPKATARLEGVVGLTVGLAVLAFDKLVALMHCRRFVRDFIPTDKREPTAALRAQAAGMRPL